ncbi:MAG: 50S ribosomal protein L14e [Nanoarchaeota archaeon]|nr:50S ribosomal protein L14e [Nanoarchaeota archaeon]MBU1622299.1 50S ribosomal protein L14e [Nanoarchaeota archaeon]MBU1973804.1 50S ribosomal protein L14e [Nanoarchaeota archaeon]
MSIYKVGRLCVKIAGRDAGRKCVVVETIDEHFVVVDGDVRRKRVNVKHLEPLAEMVEIKDKAAHEAVKVAFDKLGLAVWEKKSKPVSTRAKKQKKKKVVAEKPKKKAKKAEPKVEEKKEEVKETVAEPQPVAEKAVEDVKTEETAPATEA